MTPDLVAAMRAAIDDDPSTPQALICRVALGGQTRVIFMPSGVPSVTCPERGLVVLFDEAHEGPAGYTDRVGLQKLLASAAHAEVWSADVTTSEHAMAFLRVMKPDGVSVLVQSSDAKRAEWESWIRRFVTPRMQ